MHEERWQAQTDVLFATGFGAAICATALLVAPGYAATWLSVLAPAIVFVGYWLTLAARLSRTNSPRWLAAYPESWRRYVAVSAVSSALVASPLVAFGLGAPPFAWISLLACALGIAVRGWFAIVLIAGTLAVSLAVVPAWYVELAMPSTAARWMFASVAAMLTAAAVFIRARRSRRLAPNFEVSD